MEPADQLALEVSDDGRELLTLEAVRAVH